MSPFFPLWSCCFSHVVVLLHLHMRPVFVVGLICVSVRVLQDSCMIAAWAVLAGGSKKAAAMSFEFVLLFVFLFLLFLR